MTYVVRDRAGKFHFVGKAYVEGIIEWEALFVGYEDEAA
jgi:hypothetical protein